jgi:ABC-type lipoprotein release transport system permease subunit
MLVRTGPADPLTLATVGTLLAAVAMCAVLIPAVRASRIQPAAALRHE